MKLNLLIENILQAYTRDTAGTRLGPNQPGDPGTVSELKRALAKHQLFIPNQPPNANQKAWIGPIDDTWNQALSDAVIQWKQSIKNQSPKYRVDVNTPELSPKEIDILINSKLYTTPPSAGLLVLTDKDKPQSTPAVPAWQGRKIDLGYRINTPVESVSNTRQFLDAIGFSGWAVILDEMIKKKGYANPKNELRKMYKELYAQQNQHPYIWLQSWEDDILREDGEDLTATFLNGKEVPFLPTRGNLPNANERANVAQLLYQYFRDLGNGLLEKYQKVRKDAIQAKKNQEQGSDEDAQKTTFDQNTARVWARDMQMALTQSWWDIGSFFGTVDESSVQDLMNKLKTAKDWQTVYSVYNSMFADEDLAQRLAEQLPDEEYEDIVVRKLGNLNVISPNLLHAAINFGNTQDSITVEVSGEEYTVDKAKQNNKVIVKKGSKPVKNVIVVDQILRSAIEKSGASVPDLNVEITPEAQNEAAALVLAAVEGLAPFMVPYYTTQVPFDQAVNPGMGPDAIREYRDKAAKLLLNGTSGAAVISWIEGQVRDDADWLIGTESVHFDKRWQEETDSKEFNIGGLLDEIESATEEEKSLIERLHRDETRLEAVGEIVNSNDAATVYERIYRLFKQEHGRTLDDRALNGKIDSLKNFILEGTPVDDEGLQELVSELGVAKAAPYMMGKLFKESMNPGFWKGKGFTDEELLNKLVDTIMDREDYLEVNEYYKQIGGGDLIDDVDDEYYSFFGLREIPAVEALKKALGVPSVRSAASADLAPALLEILSDLTEDPQTDDLKKLAKALSTVENNYFAELDDNKPSDRLNQQAIVAVLNALNDIVMIRPYTDEEQELFFDMLKGIDAEVERMYNENSENFNQYIRNYWKSWKTAAEDNWFEGE